VRARFPGQCVLLVCLLGLWSCRDRDIGGASAAVSRAAGLPNTSGRSRDRFAADGKQRGVHLVTRSFFSPAELEPLLHDNVEWIALGPFAWQRDVRSSDLRMSTEGGFWGETDSGIVEIADLAHRHGMHVLLKPQIWMHHANQNGWLGDIDPGSETAWATWFTGYRAFILHYAGLAERAGIEVVCVGAELHTAVRKQPQAWRDLIGDVRKVYHGKLTYAANWHEEVEDVPFWDALDFIGVQAYYPLATEPNSSVTSMMQAWSPVCGSLRALSARVGKPVLFTEVGWKSTSDGAIRPWEWTEARESAATPVSLELQADAYEAFFRSVWSEPWFAGAYFWKWYASPARNPMARNADFTPQNKPAETVLVRWYGEVVT
jgi:glycosyl hydrolase family 113